MGVSPVLSLTLLLTQLNLFVATGVPRHGPRGPTPQETRKTKDLTYQI